MSDSKLCPALLITVAAGCIGAIGNVHAGTPTGWQQFNDKAGRCSISVPPDWKAPVIKSAPESPNKNYQAIISSSDMSKSLAEVKPVATQMMKPVKMFEDGPSRLWYEFEGNEGTGTHWYVAVPARGAVCVAQVIFKSAADLATLKTVATSLTAVH